MYYYSKKVVLCVVQGELPMMGVNRIINNYQATQKINSYEEIEPMWALNKVPVFLGTKADLISSGVEEDKIIEVPKKAAYFSVKGDSFIEFCHSNGVECGEYITGQKYIGGEENCFLCMITKEVGSSEETSIKFNATIEDASHMVLYESKNFIVKIELGCLKEGMLMVCTKEHRMSAASIPDEQFAEYVQVCRDVEYLLKNIYGDPVVFFEHGSAPDGGSTHMRAIVHQHTHVVPGIRMDLEDMDRVGMRKIDHINEMRGKKYLSYQEGVDGQLWVADNPQTYIPRQYPRKVFACMLGISYESSNWRQKAFWENIYKTYDDIHRYLTKNWEKLPERIRDAMRSFLIAYPMRQRGE